MFFAPVLSLLPFVASSLATIYTTANLTYANATIVPAQLNSTGRRSYPRTTQLLNGVLLATWDGFSPNSTGLPIYESKDSGRTWNSLSTVQSVRSDLQIHHPALYTLPEAIGSYPAGTVLLGVNAVNRNSTNIQIYASLTSGKTWEYATTVAVGGTGNTTNGATPVWEPFLYSNEGKLIAYYSDQRDTKHGQKLSHQTSTDLRTWGPVVNDVAQPDYSDRPGMTVVEKLSNNLWILVFEYGLTGTGKNYTYPVYYKIASDPEKFQEAKAVRLVASSGAKPVASPYVAWTPHGGVNGTIIVSAATHGSVFTNQALGEGNWTELATPAGRGYSRSIRILKEYSKGLFIIAGGQYSSRSSSAVMATLMDL